MSNELSIASQLFVQFRVIRACHIFRFGQIAVATDDWLQKNDPFFLKVDGLVLAQKIGVLSPARKTILCPERLRHFQGVWRSLSRIPKWVDKVKLAWDKALALWATAQKYDLFSGLYEKK